MRVEAFLDTNVLVYAVSTDVRGPIARRLLRRGGVVSVQVLNEFANVARKKLGRDWPTVEEALRSFRELLDPVLPLTVATHEAAIGLAREHALPFYDALIIASALEGGCSQLLTEDLQDNRRFGRLTVRNPFI